MYTAGKSFYTVYCSQQDKLPLLKVSRTQLKCFRGLEIIFAALFHLEFQLFLLLPASLLSCTGAGVDHCGPITRKFACSLLKIPCTPNICSFPRRGVLGAGGEGAPLLFFCLITLCVGKQGMGIPSSPAKSQLPTTSLAPFSSAE